MRRCQTGPQAEIMGELYELTKQTEASRQELKNTYDELISKFCKQDRLMALLQRPWKSVLQPYNMSMQDQQLRRGWRGHRAAFSYSFVTYS